MWLNRVSFVPGTLLSPSPRFLPCHAHGTDQHLYRLLFQAGKGTVPAPHKLQRYVGLLNMAASSVNSGKILVSPPFEIHMSDPQYSLRILKAYGFLVEFEGAPRLKNVPSPQEGKKGTNETLKQWQARVLGDEVSKVRIYRPVKVTGDTLIKDLEESHDGSFIKDVIACAVRKKEKSARQKIQDLEELFSSQLKRKRSSLRELERNHQEELSSKVAEVLEATAFLPLDDLKDLVHEMGDRIHPAVRSWALGFVPDESDEGISVKDILEHMLLRMSLMAKGSNTSEPALDERHSDQYVEKKFPPRPFLVQQYKKQLPILKNNNILLEDCTDLVRSVFPALDVYGVEIHQKPQVAIGKYTGHERIGSPLFLVAPNKDGVLEITLYRYLIDQITQSSQYPGTTPFLQPHALTSISANPGMFIDKLHAISTALASIKCSIPSGDRTTRAWHESDLIEDTLTLKDRSTRAMLEVLTR